MSTYQESEDLINIGAYVKGSNATIDKAIKHHNSITGFLKQDLNESSDYNETIKQLLTLGTGGTGK